MQRFIAPRTSPKSATSRTSRALWPRSDGRQTSSRMAAANSARSSAVPAGPISSKIVPASAAPNCSDVMATTTSGMPLASRA